MKGYKHSKRDNGLRLEQQGSVLLRPLSYYRTVEGAPPGVRDELEYSTRASHEPIRAPGILTAEQRDIADKMGFNLGAVEGVTITGSKKIFQGPELYIYCCSYESELGLIEGYDHVTPIPDLNVFARALLEATNGMFKRAFIAKVEYAEVDFAIEGGMKMPSPFVKRPEFADQRELRIALEPAERLKGDLPVQSELIRKALHAAGA